MDQLIRKLETFVKNPRETLEIEIKDWLDLDSKDHQANLMQAILAHANSGGGYIIIGFKENSGSYQDIINSGDRIRGLYNPDRINGIVRKFADPQIHVDCYNISNGVNEHPVIVVPGGHSVPIRCKHGGPENKHVKLNGYYIRRPGPASEEPQTGQEWADLIRRCVLADKEKLVEQMKSLLSGETIQVPPNSSQLEESHYMWVEETFERFLQLVQRDHESLAKSPFNKGYWFGAYSFFPKIDGLGLASLKGILRDIQGSETGWPIGLFLSREEAPMPYKGLIETWLAKTAGDPGSSDYWRSSPAGKFAIIRGHQEDNLSIFKGYPEKWFDFILPIWRVGELLLHATRFVQKLESDISSLFVTVKWTGLSGRSLKTSSQNYIMPFIGQSQQDEVFSSLLITEPLSIETNLADYVEQIIHPLFEAFNFFEIPKQTIINELKRMRNRV